MSRNSLINRPDFWRVLEHLEETDRRLEKLIPLLVEDGWTEYPVKLEVALKCVKNLMREYQRDMV